MSGAPGSNLFLTEAFLGPVPVGICACCRLDSGGAAVESHVSKTARRGASGITPLYPC